MELDRFSLAVLTTTFKGSILHQSGVSMGFQCLAYRFVKLHSLGGAAFSSLGSLLFVRLPKQRHLKLADVQMFEAKDSKGESRCSQFLVERSLSPDW